MRINKFLSVLTLATFLIYNSISLISCSTDNDETVDVDTTPTLTSFTPTSGSEGTVVTISGSNFSTTTSSNTVEFNGTSASVSSATASELVVVVPSGATTGKITVTVNAETATSSDDFTVTELTEDAPTITSFTPTSGETGVTVTITGTNFSETASENTVSFNGTKAEVTSATITELVVTLPSGATSGYITVTVDGQTATSASVFTVESDTTSLADCDDVTTVAEKVVCLANTFIASLSTSQANEVQLDFTSSNAARWSNLPGGVSIRNGLEFSELSETQLELALAVIEAASGTASNEGYDEFLQIRKADDYLGNSANGYSSEYYIIAFLGTPSTTETWMLQFGGHHYAQNITFENGDVSGTTPSHQGVEPTSWTSSGTTYAPLSTEHQAMAAMLSGLSSSELSSAKISQTFSDVLLGPGNDGEFPSTKVGLSASGLTSSQKALIMDAMEAWVGDAADDAATELLDIYESELDDTYIAYSGNASLTNHADYVRIDGPSVWIEFVCQNGVIFSAIHYHTVYRDHTRDYGGNFNF